ncbi:MAG: FHA domain-containing protein [Dokdonella sp.]
MRVLDEGRSYRIGRSAECELAIDHPSVSRSHAELDCTGAEWLLRDSGSKNGVRVEGQPVSETRLSSSTWLSVGEVYCSFELLDAAAAAQLRANEGERRATLRRLSAQISPDLSVDALIPKMLDAVLELAGLERGFVLYAEPGDTLRVRATRGLDAHDLANTDFNGSAGSVDRALASGRSVICCDTLETPWLGTRPSVRLGGIRAVVCVPVTMGGDAPGVIYADSRRPGPPITAFDVELIEHVAERAATALAARRLHDEVEGLLRNAAEAGLHAPRWNELRNPGK